MRNPTDVLNSLNKQSKDLSYRFQRLYRNLYNPEFYLLAYRNIYANEGMKCYMHSTGPIRPITKTGKPHAAYLSLIKTSPEREC